MVPDIDFCQYVFMTACCSPVFGPSMSASDAADLASRFKALADPGRLRLLALIARNGEVCGCEPVETLGLSQPTVSHHLKVLHDAGLIARERRGRWIYYRVVAEAIAAIIDTLALEPTRG